MHSFDGLAAAYAASHKEAPARVFDRACAGLHPSPAILDIGCGTGISTRQLARRFRDGVVTGLEPAHDMCRYAMEHSPERNVQYVRGAAENLDQLFPARQFDVVTAFGSFHWFCDSRTLKRLEHVLKPGGRLISVNDYDTGAFEQAYVDSIEAVTGARPLRKRDTYFPTTVLSQRGWQNVAERLCGEDQRFTLREAVLFSKSRHGWNAIPERQRADAEQALFRAYEPLVEDGAILRETQYIVVTASAPTSRSN